MGKFQNASPPTVINLFQPNFLWMGQASPKLLIGILKFILFKKLKIFVNMGPYGREISKRYSYIVMILFQANYFWIFPVTVLTRFAYWDFEN